ITRYKSHGLRSKSRSAVTANPDSLCPLLLCWRKNLNPPMPISIQPCPATFADAVRINASVARSTARPAFKGGSDDEDSQSTHVSTSQRHGRCDAHWGAYTWIATHRYGRSGWLL